MNRIANTNNVNLSSDMGPAETVPTVPAAASVGAGSTDPSVDPLHGVVANPVIVPSSIVGGTGATQPVVLEQAGGLPDALAVITGTTNSEAAAMYRESYIKSVSVSTATVRGTILDTVPFNPWSPSAVNQSALDYGSRHAAFMGGLMQTVDIVTNTTMLGRIAVCLVPEIFGADFVVSPENLYLFDHQIIDLSASGRCSVLMKPTCSEGFTVRRSDIAAGKFFGKMVIIAMSDISCTMGTTINLPFAIYGMLAPGALYYGLTGTAGVPSATKTPVFR